MLERKPEGMKMNGDIWKKVGAAMSLGAVIFSAGGAWVSLQQNAQDIREIRQDIRSMQEKVDRLLILEKAR